MSSILRMIQISEDALRKGCERAEDLFRLNRLRAYDDAGAWFDAVYWALGVDVGMRQELEKASTAATAPT
jgi:hypothetical protein